jgi:hypothetical protein
MLLLFFFLTAYLNSPFLLFILYSEREAKKKKKRRSSLPLALNHKPEDHIDLTNTIMTPAMSEKAKTVAMPTVCAGSGRNRKDIKE